MTEPESQADNPVGTNPSEETSMPPQDAIAKSIEQRRAEIEKLAEDLLAWYKKRAGTMRFWAKFWRRLAVGLVVIGSALPLVVGTGIFGTDLGKVGHLGNWGYLFLALAAGALLVDKAMGHSSGWMRYTTTGFRIEEMKGRFINRYTMLCLKAESPGEGLNTALLELIDRFHTELWNEVQSETHIWMIEYRDSLAMLERRVQSREEGLSSKPATDGRHPSVQNGSPEKPAAAKGKDVRGDSQNSVPNPPKTTKAPPLQDGTPSPNA